MGEANATDCQRFRSSWSNKSIPKKKSMNSTGERMIYNHKYEFLSENV